MDILSYMKGKNAAGGGGGGLPTPESDGAALIGVGGEWVQQSGYGYDAGTALEEAIIVGLPEYYHYIRIADVPELPDGFGDGSTVTLWVTEGSEFKDAANVTYEDGAYICEGAYIVTEEDITIGGEGGSITFGSTGVYVYYMDFGYVTSYISGFAFGADATEKLISWDGELGGVVTIDPKFIPSDSTKVNASDISHETWTFTLEDDTTVTKEVVLWEGDSE